METLPDHAEARLFLQRHLEGRAVAEIARELGVSREWCSRAYRKEALRLAGMHFLALVSAQTQKNKG